MNDNHAVFELIIFSCSVFLKLKQRMIIISKLTENPYGAQVKQKSYTYVWTNWFSVAATSSPRLCMKRYRSMRLASEKSAWVGRPTLRPRMDALIAMSGLELTAMYSKAPTRLWNSSFLFIRVSGVQRDLGRLRFVLTKLSRHPPDVGALIQLELAVLCPLNLDAMLVRYCSKTRGGEVSL